MKYIYSILAFLLIVFNAEASQIATLKHENPIPTFKSLSKKQASIKLIEKDSVPALTIISAEEQQNYKQTTKLLRKSAFYITLGLVSAILLKVGIQKACFAILLSVPWFVLSIIGLILFIKTCKKMRKSYKNWDEERKNDIGIQVLVTAILFLVGVFVVSKTEGCGD
jgi:F0F1-type ATP synthase assembly protein I